MFVNEYPALAVPRPNLVYDEPSRAVCAHNDADLARNTLQICEYVWRLQSDIFCTESDSEMIMSPYTPRQTPLFSFDRHNTVYICHPTQPNVQHKINWYFKGLWGENGGLVAVVDGWLRVMQPIEQEGFKHAMPATRPITYQNEINYNKNAPL